MQGVFFGTPENISSVHFSTNWERNTLAGTSTKVLSIRPAISSPRMVSVFRSISHHDRGDSGRRHHHMAERGVQRGQLRLKQTRRVDFPSGQVEIESMQLPAKDGRGVVLSGAWRPALGNQSSRHPPSKPRQTYTEGRRRAPPWSMSEIANRDRSRIHREWGQNWGQ